MASIFCTDQVEILKSFGQSFWDVFFLFLKSGEKLAAILYNQNAVLLSRCFTKTYEHDKL